MSSIVGDFARSKCPCADSECEHRQEIIPELPPKKADRVKGQIYINKKGEKVIWNGNRLHCEHDKFKQYCRECEGSSLCEHGKRKSRCKECGGGSICKHGKQKTHCKVCGGSSFCKHGKRKSRCKECGGCEICKHGKQKIHCKVCGGSSFCKHGKFKRYCKECGGSGFCKHGKRKPQCKECGGSSFCKHGKYKSYCKECGGSIFCKHNKDKRYCKQCGGSALCKNDWCDTIAMPKYEGYCMPCFIRNPLNADKPAHRNYKTKEKEVGLAITQRFPDATWILDKRIQDGCSARRPDVLMDLGYHVLMVEVDENQHNNYDCSCENKRLMQLAQDLGHRHMVVIRFNPDSYETIDGERVPSCWKLNKKGVVHIPKKQQKNWDARIEVLLETIQYWIDNQSEKQIEIVELFYA